ncbi:MAG: 50S ribosomal protein L18 [Candidatus Omnitrophica bacterium]|jgi:LSU ribosomal protein L18P|nr:50S ribosomal protein L18 [Candidatus Omnitrophota bacterium]
MKIARLKRHKRIRKKVVGTQERPRLSVYRSHKNMYAQLINDDANSTLLSCTTLQEECKGKRGANIKAATLLGEILAKKAKDKGIEKVVFDRGGYLYHGCIKALAEAARKGGLVF